MEHVTDIRLRVHLEHHTLLTWSANDDRQTASVATTLTCAVDRGILGAPIFFDLRLPIQFDTTPDMLVLCYIVC